MKKGIPFRDAYRNVGQAVENNTFQKPIELTHNHTGSLGNSGNSLILDRFRNKINQFNFEKAENAIRQLCI